MTRKYNRGPQADAGSAKCAQHCRENYMAPAPEGHAYPMVRVHAPDCPANPENRPPPPEGFRR